MKGLVLIGLSLVMGLMADTYITNPRGSNNRLNEATATRTNGNRLFDSQNNARGGHNTGDRFDKAAQNEPRRQYSMQYYASGPTDEEASKLIVEWTNQHGCGGNKDSPHKTNCNIVIQMMCQTNGTDADYPTGQGQGNKDLLERNTYMRDGTNTNTQAYTQPQKNEYENNNQDNKNAAYTNRMKGNYQNVQTVRGLHETVWWYDMCRFREANRGLYIADQDLKPGTLGYVGSERTRQNNNGNRRGYECPEERDYYPYWHPTHWRDIVVFTNDVKRCDWYKQESQNVKNKGYCKYPDNFLQFKQAQGVDLNRDHEVRLMNNKAACEDPENKVEHGGEMVQPVWVEDGAWKVEAPECLASPWSRDNHHGNNMDGFMNNYNWTVPDDILHKNCVLRMRYNITAGELPDGGFDPAINASLNAEKDDAPTGIDVASTYGLPKDNERGYYFQQDPVVKVFNLEDSDVKLDLEVTLNTNQYGRTFEDRTHVFEIRQRPENVPKDAKIHNLNVRGKRGNIVQTYPGVEYDYQPNRLEVDQGDYIHIQWTGADSNPGNNAGQGRARTDRNNIVPLREITYPKEGAWEDEAHGCFACNYPELFTNSTNLLGFNRDDLMALAYHTGKHYFGDIEELDDTGTHFDLGLRMIKEAGIWRFFCTRNNNFTNRSQKGEIRAIPKGEQAKRA